MPRPKLDASLRRLVSRLAGMHADDVAAILGALDAKQKQTVESLLREHAAYFDDLAPKPDGIDALGLSLWLQQRLRGDGSAMTEPARRALREVCARMQPRAAAVVPLAVAGRGAR